MNKLNPSGPNPVALIAGPTASGKSALALRLAEIADGVVINADASQVYADIPILSAAPTAEDRSRAPHRLFLHRDGASPYSAAGWAADAKREIADALAAGRLPILVGGTGLYLRTLIFGIAPVPEIDPQVRSEVRAMPVTEAHAALLREDPSMAQLGARDHSRIARALEVVRSTGRSLSSWQEQRTGGIGDDVAIRAAILLPPRDWLRQRCDARFEQMLEQGAVAEAKALHARGLPASLPVMRAIGVSEIGAWLNEQIGRSEMIAHAQAATRQYAKRQYTWFKHQPPHSWPKLTTQLNDNNISHIAIKLRDGALTE